MAAVVVTNLWAFISACIIRAGQAVQGLKPPPEALLSKLRCPVLKISPVMGNIRISSSNTLQVNDPVVHYPLFVFPTTPVLLFQFRHVMHPLPDGLLFRSQNNPISLILVAPIWQQRIVFHCKEFTCYLNCSPTAPACVGDLRIDNDLKILRVFNAWVATSAFDAAWGLLAGLCSKHFLG